ncbi:hypothetical protein HPB51_018773 [Rhipicephalus microplus]|uniref:Uncharacterized protein n=1 Tax=Rhipicephalus microplus TaxID=6941 RepID=A0A9J6DI75_RHIMP|nr:hypothetical protein HPB51_018773 [Rhipicephalus microplus]
MPPSDLSSAEAMLQPPAERLVPVGGSRKEMPCSLFRGGSVDGEVFLFDLPSTLFLSFRHHHRTLPHTHYHQSASWWAARHGKKPVRENETAGGETRAKLPLAGATHTSLRSTANPPRGWPSPRAHARPGVNEAGAAVIHIAASVPFHSPCRTERGPRQPATARKNRLAAARQVHFFPTSGRTRPYCFRTTFLFFPVSLLLHRAPKTRTPGGALFFLPAPRPQRFGHLASSSDAPAHTVSAKL